MIKIESPFKLIEPVPRYLGFGFRSAAKVVAPTKELLLAGLLVSLERNRNIFDLSSERAPDDDGFRSRGLVWGRRLIPLTAGMALEQQMLLANGGNTVALSWRLTGAALTPVRLTATPVFSANAPTSSEPFKFEAETNGGRLTWQPYHRAAKIIADTNGRCSPASANDCCVIEDDGLSRPASFEFDLGRRPAVLIFSVEAQEKTLTDPLIGGFLAELAAPQTLTTERDYLRSLVAA